MNDVYKGKVAIVTGASSGLGRDIATVYAAQGMNVVVAARRKEELDKLVVELTGAYGGKHLAVPTDLTNADSIKALFETALASYGKFDVLVNNAGDAYLWPLAEHTPEQILQLNNVLVNGNTLMHYHGIKHLNRLFAEKKIGKPIIIDILSSSAQDLYPHNGVYGPAKEYVSKLSRLNQLDNPDISFIRLYPSNIKTPLMNEKKSSPEVWGFIKDAAKLEGRDIALVVHHLTQEGKSDDVYLAQVSENGKETIHIDRLTHHKPTHERATALEEHVRKK